MRTVYLYNPWTREELKYDSISDAAKAIGAKYYTLRNALMSQTKCKGYLVSKSSLCDTPYDAKKHKPEPEQQRVELDRPHYARIGNIEFVAVKCPDKTNCKACDIYKLAPPMSMMQYPLCYEYSCRTHKIVDICPRYKCIWKKK